MIVVDTSALVAILLGEPDAATYRAAMMNADRRIVSAVSLLEAGIVLRSRQGPVAVATLETLLIQAVIEVMPFDPRHARIAIAAFERYGKGIHAAARLNFGDCAAYALAKALGVPLLFKGNDFVATDIASALPVAP